MSPTSSEALVPVPLQRTDADPAAALMLEGLADLDRRMAREAGGTSESDRSFLVQLIRRFTETDPEGCWACWEDDRLVGFSVSIRRGSVWGLALLFVSPTHQSTGLGRRLLARAAATSAGASRLMIKATDDARAIRAYSSLGLHLLPSVEASGPVRKDLVDADLAIELDPGAEARRLIDDLDLSLRNSSRSADALALVEAGASLLQPADDGQRGYAVHHDGTPLLLSANSLASAAALLEGCLARAGEEARVSNLTASQQWAFPVLLRAGLRIRPAGPFFTSGDPALPGPYLASSFYF